MKRRRVVDSRVRAGAPGAGADRGFGEDEVLFLVRWLAEHGEVATLSADGGGACPDRGRPWTFRLLGRGIETEAATAGDCVRAALPILQVAYPPGGPLGALPEVGADGTGTLVLEWLVDQGMRVFLKADGGRRVPGWTFLVHRGPLQEQLRSDGPVLEQRFDSMLALLAAAGIAVPV